MNRRPIVSVTRTVRGSIPNVPFEKIARAMLGQRYTLSLVLCGDTLALRMNKTYRKKTYVPNVLSFALGKDEGEIFLNTRVAAREARSIKISEGRRIAHLFAHGCLHLSGMRHGKKMDGLEESILDKFGF